VRIVLAVIGIKRRLVSHRRRSRRADGEVPPARHHVLA
jgi:hypothetical protein